MNNYCIFLEGTGVVRTVIHSAEDNDHLSLCKELLYRLRFLRKKRVLLRYQTLKDQKWEAQMTLVRREIKAIHQSFYLTNKLRKQHVQIVPEEL